jgi:hypothetical protein
MKEAKKPPAKSELTHPRNVDKGGVEARPSQPMRKASLREPYGARSGEAPQTTGTPDAIGRAKDAPRSGRGKG